MKSTWATGVVATAGVSAARAGAAAKVVGVAGAGGTVLEYGIADTRLLELELRRL